MSVQHATACTRAWPRGKPRPMHMLRLHMYKPFVAPVHATDCTCPTPVVAMCMHLVAMYTTPPLDCTFTPRDPWVSLGWRHERSASQHAGAGLSMQLHGSGAGRHASGSHATPPRFPSPSPYLSPALPFQWTTQNSRLGTSPCTASPAFRSALVGSLHSPTQPVV